MRRSTTLGHLAGRSGNAGVPAWACQLPLQRCECVNEFGSLESPIAPPDVNLYEHPCFHKAGNGQVCSLERPAGQFRRSTRRQGPEPAGSAPMTRRIVESRLGLPTRSVQEACRFPNLLLESPGILNCPTRSSGEQHYPPVDSHVCNVRIRRS